MQRRARAPDCPRVRDNNHTEWQELFGQYSVPPLVPPDASVALSFGLGVRTGTHFGGHDAGLAGLTNLLAPTLVQGPGSGVPFHIHGPGWSETVIGRKLWYAATRGCRAGSSSAACSRPLNVSTIALLRRPCRAAQAAVPTGRAASV